MKRKYIITTISLLLIVLFSACKVGKNYQRPEVSMPQKFGNVSFSDTSSIADLPWNVFFEDVSLQALIN
jgi:outer membrane protein, multidrug efflux system